MDMDSLQQRQNDLEVKVARNEQMITAMSHDMHEMRSDVKSISETIKKLSDYVTGKKAIAGFFLGIASVIGAIGGVLVVIYQVIKELVK